MPLNYYSSKMLYMDETKDNIRIRSLLSRYYDGLTSGTEKIELISLFRNSSRLPPDLENERKVFMAIECDSIPEAEAPAYLEERILRSISTSEKHWPSTIWISSAAAIIVLLFMGWKVFSISDGQMEFHTSPLPDLATISPAQTEVAAAEITLAIPENRTTKSSSGKSLASSGKAQARINRTERSAGNREVTTVPVVPNHRIITDQEEADRIIDHVFTMMSGKMYAAEIACDRPEIIIESINRSLAKIEL